MKSIFAAEDAVLNPQPRFWQLDRERHSPLLQPLPCSRFEGMLKVRVDCTHFKPRYFIVTHSQLFFCKVTNTQSAKDRRPLKSVFLSWKLLDPFIETDSSIDLFGFRLGTEDRHEDFYAETNSDLDRWLVVLQPLCILSDLLKDLHLSSTIGTGTFSTVFLAQDRDSGELLAVKSVRKSLLTTCENNREMHVKEIAVLRNVSHPRVVKLLKVYEDEDSIHLVMDYQAGGDLYSRILKLHRFTEPKAAALFRRLLEVVHYLHSAGYVHRDIKPENIFLVSPDVDCEFKLGDFGLATEAGPGSLHLKCGSPGYLAPEMLRWARYGPKADLFSCGVVLYFLLSGRPPFDGKTLGEVMGKNRACSVYFQEQQWKGVSKEAVELVLRLVHPDPMQRIDAEQALQHAWLKRKSPLAELQPSRIASHLPGRPSENRISHELMTRLTRKGPETKSPSLEKASEKRKKDCLASLRLEVNSSGNSSKLSGEVDDTSENGEKDTVRVRTTRGPGTILLSLER